MPESIIVHFSSADRDSVAGVLHRAGALAVGAAAWRYPADDARSTLMLVKYDDAAREYDEDEIDRLRVELGRLPTMSLTIEMRRSGGEQAVDDAAFISRHLLRHLDGVVDDTVSNIWRLAEIDAGVIKGGGAFLACYRHSEGKT